MYHGEPFEQQEEDFNRRKYIIFAVKCDGSLASYTIYNDYLISSSL